MSLQTVALVACSSFCFNAVAQANWEPTKSVEFIVPAGTGGGADQMARFLQGVISKHKIMAHPLVVVNKSGGAGAEGFLDAKGARPDGHKIIITLSNLFTTPLATGVPFNWKDLTPVAMLALDEFVLWVNAESPYKTVGDLTKAVKQGESGKFKMAGTGSKQEDQIITVAIEKATAKKMIYVPFKGGGDVAVQLVGKHVDTTVNNPIEAVAHWKGGTLRALCVFDSQVMPYPKKITPTQSWKDVPTCKSQGLDVEYLMLRGIFMPPKATPAQVLKDLIMKTGEHLQMRWMELLVAACFVGVSLLVITDSLRVGNAWGSDGPEPGYFPFFIGCLLLGGASWVIVQTLLAWKQDDGKEVFAEKHEFNLMLLMLLPTAAFTAAIFVLGIYVASVVFIAAFMVWQGKYSYFKSIAVGSGISAALFVLFEVWFMLPLPKGFIHTWLGY